MINLELKAVGLELTPAIKAYAEEKVQSLEKYISSQVDPALAQVELSKLTEHHKSGEIFSCSINLQITGRPHIFTEETSEDLYAAIDKVRDELIRQITSTKDKSQTRFRRGARQLKNLFRGWKI